MRSQTHARHFLVRKLTCDEALAHGHRLRRIYRDAVLGAGPQRYSDEQVAAWAGGADALERWDAWMLEGSTWVAAPEDAAHHLVGMLMMRPADHVHLLYVDPAFHRRGIASVLLDAVEPDARAVGIAALTTHASLVARPVFLARGYEVVAMERSEVRGEVFRRARMRKVLR